MRKDVWWLALLFAAILAAMAAKGLLEQPPLPPTPSIAGRFDASRAKARLAFILGDQRPHPADTAADATVRERIIGELQAFGLHPLVRDQFACNELYKQRGVSCARVRNVLAFLGPAHGKAVLLNAHYDSTPVGPGAGDDGIGVATLLEVGALLKDRPLRRPVVLLFNEGEELGLVGARAFLADPLGADVDSLVNVEARGVRGPVNMFETSRPNAAAIALFSRVVGRPAANSLSTDVYRLMPNYTDVNSFSERGWLTLNLAPIGNETRYHSPGDSIDALDIATLQHMGDQTLALATALASDARPSSSGDRIFMDVANRVLVSLPLWLGVSLFVILLVTAAAASWSGGPILRGVAVTVTTIVASSLLSFVLLELIGLVRPGMFWRAEPIWAHLATYASVILVGSVLLATLAKPLSARQLRAGFWLVFLVIGGMIGLIAPGGIIFFLFPPLLGLGGLLAAGRWKAAGPIGAALAISVLFLTWGAMLGILEELLNSGPLWVFAPLGALLILPILIEARAWIDGAGVKTVSALAGGIAVAGWAIAAAVPAYSADRQQRFVIEHVTDANEGKAYWSLLDGGVPVCSRSGCPWPTATSGWHLGKLPYAAGKRWLIDAPAMSGTQAPRVEAISAVTNGKERTVTLRLQSKGAERVALIAPDDRRIRSAGTPGFVRPIDGDAEQGSYALSCSGRSCDGTTFVIVADDPKPIEFIVVGARNGLPPSAAALLAARPHFSRPQYTPDETVVFSRVRI